ncbi:ABC transporter ATP-binding protein [Bradyrhizobium jicamae]|uniref:ABC transporter ATP-binding protein n=1 Tax=Bradyrhizobium jicamae TaxID=280332 RepID=UPI001BAA9192|nr:ABC transporter ATP-binding protein [Bradyrhizobium jicamae]MBR0752183.1 ABC transporter ATP-binding protein [Bradyrhizobium jicamae]
MLEVSNLGVRYGRHIALQGVSLRVEKGEISVMLGANGAGKSTLLKAVAGIVPSEPGTQVRMNGRAISGLEAHRIVEQGIALVPEGRGVFGDLSVEENLALGAFAKRARGTKQSTLQLIFGLFPRLAERKRQQVRTMSGGEQQMVAISRALMSRPDILMLDEPSLGLSPLLSKELFRSLKTIAESGYGILLVEQNAKLSLKIADRGYLIENGAIAGEDTADNLRHNPAVLSAYLGGRASNAPISTALPIALGDVKAIADSIKNIDRSGGH